MVGTKQLILSAPTITVAGTFRTLSCDGESLNVSGGVDFTFPTAAKSLHIERAYLHLSASVSPTVTVYRYTVVVYEISLTSITSKYLDLAPCEFPIMDEVITKINVSQVAATCDVTIIVRC